MSTQNRMAYFDEKGRLCLPSTLGTFHLTKKEVVILKYILLGYTSKIIARMLTLSSRTVEEYTDKIKRKLKCTQKYQIHRAVIEYGMTTLLAQTILDEATRS